MRNKYWPILNIPEEVQGDYSIKHLHFKAGYEFKTATARSALMGMQKSETVQFTTDVRFHELHHKEQGVWMTDVPVEQAQCNTAIVDYEGDVLVGGLGLGYAVARIAANPMVDSVTVVEISKEVIALTAPHLPNVDKITVVNADLFEYLNTVQHKVFDHAFYDIWQSDSENTFFHVVIPLLKRSQCVLSTPDCWNEDVMRGQLYFGLMGNMHLFTMSSEDRAKLGFELPPLEEMATMKDDIWWDWKVPFFQWYLSVRGFASKATVDDALAQYIQIYGRPEFEELWPPTQ